MQVDEISSIAKERVDLAKALIRAVDKPKAKAKAAEGCLWRSQCLVALAKNGLVYHPFSLRYVSSPTNCSLKGFDRGP